MDDLDVPQRSYLRVVNVNEQLLTRLHADATAGAPAAARELGRLLNMPPGDPSDTEVAECYEGVSWAGEPWLRAALAADPGDATAALLLAGQLVRQIHEDSVLGAIDAAGPADSRRAVERRIQEAGDLYAQAQLSDPGNRTAAAGLDLLAQLRAGTAPEPVGGPADSAYGFYLLAMEVYSGSAGSVLRWAAPDLDELCWAFDVVTPLMQDFLFLDGGSTPPVVLTLSVVDAGRVVHSIDLGESVVHDDDTGLDRVAWNGLDVPPLQGQPLPVGHFVDVPGHAYPVHYGFSIHHDV